MHWCIREWEFIVWLHGVSPVCSAWRDRGESCSCWWLLGSCLCWWSAPCPHKACLCCSWDPVQGTDLGLSLRWEEQSAESPVKWSWEENFPWQWHSCEMLNFADKSRSLSGWVSRWFPLYTNEMWPSETLVPKPKPYCISFCTYWAAVLFSASRCSSRCLPWLSIPHDVWKAVEYPCFPLCTAEQECTNCSFFWITRAHRDRCALVVNVSLLWIVTTQTW